MKWKIPDESGAPLARREGTVERRGTSTWRIRWYLGQDSASGKRRYGSKTIHGSKRDAERALSVTQGLKESGLINDSGRTQPQVSKERPHVQAEYLGVTLDGSPGSLPLQRRQPFIEKGVKPWKT